MKKYGKGWHNDSERHRLARMGVKTGRRSPMDYASVSLDNLKYEPVSISSPEVETPSDQEVMGDVDTIVAGSDIEIEQPDVQDVDVDLDTLPAPKVDFVEDEIKELEADMASYHPLKKTFKERITDTVKGIANFYTNGSGNLTSIDRDLERLAITKEELQTRIGLIQKIKNDVLSDKYKQDVGVGKQLQQLRRVDTLLAEPKRQLGKTNATITTLNRKKVSLERMENIKSRRAGITPKKKESSGIFPSFSEILDPTKIK